MVGVDCNLYWRVWSARKVGNDEFLEHAWHADGLPLLPRALGQSSKTDAITRGHRRPVLL